MLTELSPARMNAVSHLQNGKFAANVNMDAEVIVVGAGIVGLWTAYQLVKSGVKVILLEQVCIAIPKFVSFE